jgi:hypothetical protein
MIYGADKHDISVTEYLCGGVGRAIGRIYRVLFEWWIDVPMARREHENLAREIREELPSLFADYGGRIVPNEGVRRPSDHCCVTIAIEHLLLRFCRWHGELVVHVASTVDSARDWKDWKDVEAVLSVLDRPKQYKPLGWVWNLRTARHVLQAELGSLLEATSEGQWSLVKRKVNARFSGLQRMR